MPKTLAIRLDDDLHAAAAAVAQLQGTSLTELIRTAIEEHLEAQKANGALAEQAGLTHTYRLGGDEFLAVAADMDEQGAAAMAEAIRKGFKRRNVSVSLGHAVFTAPFPPMEEMLNVIDGKMYEDKRERERER